MDADSGTRWLLEGRRVENGLGIENTKVGILADFDGSLIMQTEPTGGKARHSMHGVLER